MENFDLVSRRNFVRTASVGLGALSLASLWPLSVSAKPGKKLGIALVG